MNKAFLHMTDVEKIEYLTNQLRDSKAKNKILSSRLITQQEDTQGQAQFLDALENLLEDHGFKVVSINE